MKSSNSFREVISAHLELTALRDPLFFETLKKENKSIDECINYILKTVQSSGQNGFEDNEIYAMAVHYYDEDDINNIKPISAKVVINHKELLSLEEIDDAKKLARETVMTEEIERIKKKTVVKKTETSKKQTTKLF